MIVIDNTIIHIFYPWTNNVKLTMFFTVYDYKLT